jgi:acetate kinase
MDMKILVVNAGSSSLKYQLIDMKDESVLAKGICERIGTDKGHIKHSTADGRKFEADADMPTHSEAFDECVKALTGDEYGVIKSMSEINAVGHRIVQGGAIFSRSVLVDDKALADIDELSELAPLHNPAHVLGIRACIKCLGENVPQVAVFDTSFHSTMPATSYMYALPYEYYEKYKIRRYGAHGTSHRYVSDRCAEMLGVDKKDIKIITCHLGNGCSITAIKDGKCFDTSMGLTPLDGFMMGTRCGGIDPSAVTYAMDKLGLTPKQMSDVMNKQSGVLGISGVSNDNRDVTKAAEEGNERAKLACDMQVYQIRKFIGSYIAAMDGVDAIVFTGGIGENDSRTRREVCKDMSFFGVEIDNDLNETIHGKECLLSTEASRVKVLVIPTNEELVIARDTVALITK